MRCRRVPKRSSVTQTLGRVTRSIEPDRFKAEGGRGRRRRRRRVPPHDTTQYSSVAGWQNEEQRRSVLRRRETGQSVTPPDVDHFPTRAFGAGTQPRRMPPTAKASGAGGAGRLAGDSGEPGEHMARGGDRRRRIKGRTWDERKWKIMAVREPGTGNRRQTGGWGRAGGWGAGEGP